MLSSYYWRSVLRFEATVLLVLAPALIAFGIWALAETLSGNAGNFTTAYLVSIQNLAFGTFGMIAGALISYRLHRSRNFDEASDHRPVPPLRFRPNGA